MKVLVIPSATLVSKEMQKKVGKIPTILCPIKDRTMLDYLMDQYSSQVDQIIIVGFKKINEIKSFIRYRNYNIEILELDELKDLGYTVRFGVKYAIENYKSIEKLYVNFADILVEDLFNTKYNDSIIYSKDYSGDEWTYFQNDELGKLVDIWDKTEVDLKTKQDVKLFVGVICITNIKSFDNDLQEAIYHIPKPDKKWDSFYHALYSYSKKHVMSYVLSNKWLDVGHAENYFKAKTGVAARVFNTIEIDEERGILKKTSKNKEKLINEIKWYLKVPERLQYLTPRIYNYSTNIDNPYVEMEYYGYNTLHELLIWGNLTIEQWEKYFNKLKFIVEDMQKYKYVDNKTKLDSSLRNIYIAKTITRLKQVQQDEKLAIFFDYPIVINGTKYRTLKDYLFIIPELVEKILITRWVPEFTIIHGDLCFSNILIESNYGFMRIIDPRGEFGGFDIYGDPRYEMAKLMHSIEGKYDFIIEDMFEISIKKNAISFSIMEKEPCIINVFRSVFQKQLINYRELELIEALLFLSMIPLHSDYPTRQLAMLCTGVQLFEKVMGEVTTNDK